MRKTIRTALLTTVTVAVATVGVSVAAQPAAAADPPGGSGTATTKTVNVAHLTKLTTRPAGAVPGTSLARAAAATASFAAATTAGSAKPAATRPAPPPVRSGSANGSTSGLAAPSVAAPAVAPALVSSFDGLTEATACGSCQPAQASAAVGLAEIVQFTNNHFAAFGKTGTEVCDVGLSTLLATDDVLSRPRVQYDNVAHRYSFVATVLPAQSTAVPAIWVGATTDDEACGIWDVARVTFTGAAFPGGTLVDFPILGQDRNALLISTDNITPTGENFTVFGIPKSAVYAATSFTFTAFGTASRTAPVSNGGIPMISTSSSYFLGSVPGAGYRLYRMTNSAGPGTTVTLLASLSAPFSAPSRRITQPGTSVTLDPLDGRITSSPVNDGTFIWFAHGLSFSTFPTVLYGALSLIDGSITEALAYHTNTSDDFNPSIGVGNNPGGGNFIFVNWAYTDSSVGTAASVTIDSVAPHGGVPDLVGSGSTLATGSRTTVESRFGDYSSVAIDPSVAAGSCAVATQQYFAPAGTWKTRIVRVGRCA